MIARFLRGALEYARAAVRRKSRSGTFLSPRSEVFSPGRRFVSFAAACWLLAGSRNVPDARLHHTRASNTA